MIGQSGASFANGLSYTSDVRDRRAPRQHEWDSVKLDARFLVEVLETPTPNASGMRVERWVRQGKPFANSNWAHDERDALEREGKTARVRTVLV